MKTAKLRIFTATALLLTAIFSALLLSACNKRVWREYYHEYDAAEIVSVNVDVHDRNVIFKVTDDGKITLNGYDCDQEYYETTLDGGTMNIVLTDNKDLSDYIGYNDGECKDTLTIGIPQSALDRLTISTNNGNVDLANLLVGGNIEVSVNNGDIRLNGAAAGVSAQYVVKNGNIGGTVGGNYSDYEISVTIKKGGSNLENKTDGSKKLALNVNNGDVNLGFAE